MFLIFVDTAIIGTSIEVTYLSELSWPHFSNVPCYRLLANSGRARIYAAAAVAAPDGWSPDEFSAPSLHYRPSRPRRNDIESSAARRDHDEAADNGR